MSRRSKVALRVLIVTAALGAGASAHANLLTNGSFELGTFTDQGNDTQSLLVSATTMTGWTVVNHDLAWIGASNPFGLSAQDGKFFLDLTDYNLGAPFGGVTQTIATTAGQPYNLSFYLGSRTDLWGGPPVSITASAGSTSRVFTDNAAHNSSTWTLETLSFIATGSSTAITLTGAAGVNYIGLDNVDLELGAVGAVPEPSTYALLLAGAGLLGWVARRRAEFPR